LDFVICYFIENLMNLEEQVSGITYRDAGVNIEEGDKAVKNIKEMVRSTHSSNVLTDLGSFGGMFQLNKENYDEPVLVSSTDVVGTKLKIAFLTDRHDTVGEDLVNHCVNDIAVGGALPLFFLDYFATDKLQSAVFSDVISGFVRGCKNNGCALIGGETAEMPDMYQKGEYDLSGTIVGIVEKGGAINGKDIKKSDILIGLPSSGLHTNGYSLARKILLGHYNVSDRVEDLACSVGEELLKVHISYLKVIQLAVKKFNIHGISHITGGGIEGNTRRILSNGLDMSIDWSAWEPLPVFSLIQKLGNVPVEDMRQTFNLGIGIVFILSRDSSQSFYDFLKQNGQKPCFIGEII
jgi:phosphoribosylformylglycinamidine cyclo-ligase